MMHRPCRTFRGWLLVAAAVISMSAARVASAADDAAPRVEAPISPLAAAEEAPTLITGTVHRGDGTPVEGAVVVTSLGGRAISGADGSFELAVDAPPQTSSANVTAVAQVDGRSWTGTTIVRPLVRGGLTRAGGVALSAGGACSPSWLPTFGGQPGTNDFIRALAVFDDGLGAGPALYVAGDFTAVAGTAANRIARWDGTSWSPLGGGLSGTVLALVVHDDGSGSGPALYAGGGFLSAGGTGATRIARWNGSAWANLGSGLNSTVSALAVYDDGSGAALYAAGSFTTAGGVAASRVARWNGSTWAALGSGANGSVNALQVHDDGSGFGSSLYAGGTFTTAGDIIVDRIARWDGSSWSPLAAAGLDSTVFAMAVHDDGSGAGPALYAAGNFTSAGGVAANRIARWNGSSWAALASGLNSAVRTLAVHDDGSGVGPLLYAAGNLTSAGGVAASRIARWNGSAWAPVGNGTEGTVLALAVHDDGSGGGPVLHAGGAFDFASGTPASNLAHWDGSSWMALTRGLNGTVLALSVHDDGSGGGRALYAGGSFSGAGGSVRNRIARWDGTSWMSLGSGMGNDVTALAVYDDGSGGGPALYAGGLFTSAGGIGAARIAKWSGSSWASVGSGLNSDVHALAVYDDGSGPGLYAAGWFSGGGGVTASRIARWNGSSWAALGSGLSSSSANALIVHDDGSGPALYVGGNFTIAGGLTVNRIARWDGSDWSALGSGMNSSVNALAVHDDGSGAGPLLYAAGNFTTAGGVTVNRIARWDGASWTALGSGVNSTAYSLASYDDGSGPGLYLGGFFFSAGGVPASHIARWDGSLWGSLDIGVSDGVVAMTVYDDRSGTGPTLHAGGYFGVSPAGDSFIANWGGCAPLPELSVSVELQDVDPGPFERCITFELHDCGGGSTSVSAPMTFTNGLADAIVELPSGTYDCITVRDPLHTLRRTDDDGDFVVSGTDYFADFTSGGGSDDSLVAGNLNDDAFIDILDFGLFMSQYGATYGTADTTCSTSSPHADFNGDGEVDVEDFTYIQVHFFAQREAGCCGAGAATAPATSVSERVDRSLRFGAAGPLLRVALGDLAGLGAGRAVAGDLNADGWVDVVDVAAFLGSAP